MNACVLGIDRQSLGEKAMTTDKGQDNESESKVARK